MSSYLDTSALAKLEIQEMGTEEVHDLVRASVALTSIVTRAELTSALHRAVARGNLSEEQGERARLQFQRIWRALGHVAVTQSVAERAERLVWKHRVRGLDGIHLASALTVQDRLGEPIRFATFDSALWRAARDEGLDAWPPGWGD